MKKSLKLRAVVSPTPAIIAAAYDENGKYSLEKLNPIIYDEEHFAYRAVGSKTADAFKAGFITGENICIDGGMTRNMIYHNDFGWRLER